MEYLRILLKDYKNENDDILVADKQLQIELFYDIKSMNSAKAKSRLLPKCENQAAISCLMFLRLLVENMRRISSPISQKDNSKLASAMVDAAAATTTCSVLRELNKGASTPPLSSLSVPKLIR